MRTFRNPQGDGGHNVIIAADSGAVVIRPGEQAEVDLPDEQPCPDLLEEVGGSSRDRETQPSTPAPVGVVDTPAPPEPTPPDEEPD